MTIRAAHHAELAQLTLLARRSKACWGYSAAFMRGCEAELTVHPELLPHVFVDQAADAITGFYALSLCDRERAELEFLFVEPGRMRGGVGRRLVLHACALARSWGCRCILIQGDPHALAFYRAVGAVFTGTRASASIEGRRLPLLELMCR